MPVLGGAIAGLTGDPRIWRLWVKSIQEELEDRERRYYHVAEVGISP